MMRTWVLRATTAALTGLMAGSCGSNQRTGDDEGAADGDEGGGDSADGETGGLGSADGGTEGETSAGGDDGLDPPIKYDLGTIPDAPGDGCGGNGGGGLELSYIWISNSSQGTISKIDTQTIVEEGRYSAKQSFGDPSRTSVNLNGDVAVANRNGGVAKFWADVTDCVDTNGTPGIQTSSGPGDVLAWGQDDCLAWYHDFTCNSNRPVAWTRGEWNAATCSYQDAQLWTVCDSTVYRLNGETGDIDDTVIVPGGQFPFVYGGAADADGNFWGLDTGSGTIFRVDGGDLSVLSYPLPPQGGYGITVDKEGRPWVCGGGGVARFNLTDSTWDGTGTGGIGGCMTDGADTIWHSSSAGILLGFDIETLNNTEQIQLPEYVHGVSVDFFGFVWGVGFANNNAYRADPVTDDVQTYNGLMGAYTYSDMTGFALSSAGGGGVPQG